MIAKSYSVKGNLRKVSRSTNVCRFRTSKRRNLQAITLINEEERILKQNLHDNMQNNFFQKTKKQISMNVFLRYRVQKKIMGPLKKKTSQKKN